MIKSPTTLLRITVGLANVLHLSISSSAVENHSISILLSLRIGFSLVPWQTWTLSVSLSQKSLPQELFSKSYSGTTITVVTILWKLTIGIKKAFSDSDANNERTKRLESKARALATAVGEAGNLYNTDVTGAGDPPATEQEQGIQKKIQKELSECEKDLNRYDDQIEEILRSQGRGNQILRRIKDKLLDNDVGLGLDQMERSITDHQSNLQLLIQAIQE